MSEDALIKNRAIVNIFLKPGEFFVSKEPVAIKTILGSCVSVCLHDRVLKIGGMNHVVHPARSVDKNLPASFYANESVYDLVERLESLGANKNNLIAKIVGGSNIMMSETVAVGPKNLDYVREALKELGIPVEKEHVLGAKGRKIVFQPHSGELLVNVLGEVSYKEEEQAKSGKHYITLDDNQRMCFEKIFSFAVKEVERVISELVNQKTTIDVFDLAFHKMSYVQDFLRKEFTDCLVETGESADGPFGETLMMLPTRKAALLVNHLLERDLNTNIHFDEMEKSVVIEVANILTNGLLGKLANAFECQLTMRPHNFIHEMDHLSDLAFMKPAKSWKGCLVLKANFEIPGIDLKSHLYFLIELNSIYNLLEKL